MVDGRLRSSMKCWFRAGEYALGRFWSVGGDGGYGG